MMTLWKVN